MLGTVLILSLLSVTAVQSDDCTCFTSNTTAKKIGIANAYSTSDFSACYSAPCAFVATSGDPTVGWTSITVTLASSDPTGVITIYDGVDDSANRAIIQKINASGTYPLTSSTPSVYVKYTQNDPKSPNTYYGSMIANSGLAPPTTIAPSTLAPTTRLFTDPNFSRDPHLISHDLLVLVNQRTSLGAAGLTALTTMATTFVRLLSVTGGKTSQTSQTRLGLATVTPYAPNFAAQGEIWNMTIDEVVSALPKTGVTSDVDINTALKLVVPAFFNVSDSISPTRKNVQRSIILFTAWWGSSVLDETIKEVFANYGVNLAIVGYQTTSDNLKTNDWYNYVSLTDASDASVNSFVNRFYLNSALGNTLTNNWCRKGEEPVSGGFIQEPSDYMGPDSTLDNPQWGSTDGQKSRYCNFQDTTYTYNRADPAKVVDITVYYELEVENDHLKFYADGVEIESFTGIGVNSANFQVSANTITARFTTDYAGVQRGFRAYFNEV